MGNAGIVGHAREKQCVALAVWYLTYDAGLRRMLPTVTGC